MENGQLWVLVLAAGEGGDTGHATTTGASLREVLNLATAVAPRRRICAVVTQEQRRRMEGPLWFLPASNVVAQPPRGGNAYGILLTLLRIAERDPGARIVLLPSMHHVQDEETFAASLRNVAADTAYGVAPDAAGTGIVMGAVRALLQVFGRRMPGMVAEMRELARRDSRGREDSIALADLFERLPYLDFHRHVLSGQERHLVCPVPLPLNAKDST